MKRCPKCETLRDREDFYPIRKDEPDGKLYTYCRECTRAMRKKAWQVKHPPKRIPEKPEPVAPFEYTDGNTVRFEDLGKRGMIVGIESLHDPDEALAVELPPEQIKLSRKWQDRLICLQETKG